ncbi:SPFH domain-containing protein [Streptomyces sp. NPDC057682]|uniref:SPFH domain-containing protein n=1 Tax=Streptomyces sp. NPDC057682 TaxID=3346210 RepID=UPI0036BD4C5B
MRFTVSDGSGTPEDREGPDRTEPEYGEERYGTVPVREWVGPGGAGSVTDAWAAAADAALQGDDRPAPSTTAPDTGRVPAPDPAPETEGGPDPGADPDGVPGTGFRADARTEPGAGPGTGSRAEPGADLRREARTEARTEPAADLRTDPGPDSVVDLVLDLVPGESAREGAGFGATSASVSVPAAGGGGPAGGARDLVPAPAAETAPGAVRSAPPAAEAVSVAARSGSPVAETVPVGARTGAPAAEAVPVPVQAPEDGAGVLVLAGAAGPVPAEAEAGAGEARGAALEHRGDPRTDTGRHQAVIAGERTAAIPVHLLFRDEPEAPADAAALPVAVLGTAPGGERPAGIRRPPVPRTPQVRPSTRPAPVADPRLLERPGPALPGWAAVLTGLVGTAAAGAVLWWSGALPARLLALAGVGPRPYDGVGGGVWAALAVLGFIVLFALGGLSRGRVGSAWVLTLFGQYRGTVRRTGLMWISPLLLRRRVDVRLRHWRSEPLPAVDANGTALRVVVLVVWRVKDTARAVLGIEDHEEYLREQVESAMARVLSQLPADAFHEDAHTLRNAEAVGDALTLMLKADCEPVGIEVYSAQPTGIEYAPEIAAAMQRRRIAAIDAQHRDSVLTSVVDAVDDTVNRLTARGLVELDDYERKSLVKDLTVAFYTGRGGGDSA